MSKNVSFYTLGCRSNQSETSVLKNLFSQSGFRVVDPKKSCDIAVINTCTVTEKGDNDAKKLVNRINRQNPKVKIALIGCQAQTQKDELKKLPNVRWIVGNAKKMELASLIDQVDSEALQVVVPPIPSETFTVPVSGIDKDRTRANIKIQDGCNSFCAYCEIPYARGRARSRRFDDILKEAKALSEAGHREIVLTGINIGAYQDKNKTLLDVVQALDSLPALDRIRLSSIEPKTIPYDLILFMGTKSKLCRYLHIPIQSGCDAVLEKMGRKYRTEDLEAFFEFTITDVKDVCLGADVIVGFPGETDSDFEKTFMFLENAPLAYFHTFSYSNRKFAQSHKFPDQVNRTVIQKRSERLRQLSLLKKKNFLKKFIGTSQKTLFEEKKRNLWTGLTDNYLRIQVISNLDLRNKISHVHVKSLEEDLLIGEIQ